MFTINDDLSIYATRGDTVFFTVTAEENGVPYEFKAGDVLRMKIFGKKDAESVVLEKEFGVTAETDKFTILLTEEDTKIGEVISKPKDYWYEIELNPFTNPQTIIGYDEDGAKVFKLYPEGKDSVVDDPDPEDIPIVDDELDLTSTRPVQNQAIARAIVNLEDAYVTTQKEVNQKIADTEAKVQETVNAAYAELSVEYSRMDAFVSLKEGSTTGDAELQDIRVDSNGVIWNNAGNSVRGITRYLDERLNDITHFKTVNVATSLNNGYYNTDGVLTTHDIHKHTTIAVSGGEVYFIKTYYGYVVPDALVLDGSGKMLHYYHTNAEALTDSDFNKAIVIPAGASTMVVNVCSNHAYEIRKATACELKLDSVDRYIGNVFSSMVFEGEELSDNLCKEYREKTLIPENGKVEEYNNDKYVTTEISVSPGERLRIEYGYSYTNYGFVFLDNNDEVISGSALGDGTATVNSVSEVVTVPFKAVKLILAHITTSGMPRAYKILGYKGNTLKWQHNKWVCVGDSLTEANSRTSKNYHDYIAEKTGINVVNMGLSGTGYKRTEAEGNAFYQRISNVPHDSDVVTIFGSGNDLAHIDVLGDPNDTTTETICGCVNRTIDNLYSVLPTVQLGIISPTPWVGNQPSDNGAMTRYSDALKKICELRGIPFLDLYRCSSFRPNDEEYRTLVFSNDEGNGVHPNEVGHKIIASRVKAFLDSLIL